MKKKDYWNEAEDGLIMYAEYTDDNGDYEREEYFDEGVPMDEVDNIPIPKGYITQGVEEDDDGVYKIIFQEEPSYYEMDDEEKKEYLEKMKKGYVAKSGDIKLGRYFVPKYRFDSQVARTVYDISDGVGGKRVVHFIDHMQSDDVIGMKQEDFLDNTFGPGGGEYIHESERGEESPGVNYEKGGDIKKGYHKMPDGTIMKDSEHMEKGGIVDLKKFGAKYNTKTKQITFGGNNFGVDTFDFDEIYNSKRIAKNFPTKKDKLELKKELDYLKKEQKKQFEKGGVTPHYNAVAFSLSDFPIISKRFSNEKEAIEWGKNKFKEDEVGLVEINRVRPQVENPTLIDTVYRVNDTYPLGERVVMKPYAKGGITYVNDDFPELVDSQTYVIDGVYGGNERESEIYVKELSDGGKWYALRDSKNINFTNDSLYDGINVEEVQDLETISSSSPIEYADDLDERIVSHYGEEMEERGDDDFAKGGEIIVKTRNKIVRKKGFDDWSKSEIKEWGESVGWNYNKEGDKYGGQALKDDEFFIKSYAKGGKLSGDDKKSIDEFIEEDISMSDKYDDMGLDTLNYEEYATEITEQEIVDKSKKKDVLKYIKSTLGKRDEYMQDFAKGGKVLVGRFNEKQLKNKEDKKAIEKAQKESGLTYIDSKIIKKGGKMFMEVHLIPNEEYYNSSKFAKGGEVKKKSDNSILIGGLAGVILGIILKK